MEEQMNIWLDEKQKDYDEKRNNILKDHENLLEEYSKQESFLSNENENEAIDNDLQKIAKQ